MSEALPTTPDQIPAFGAVRPAFHQITESPLNRATADQLRVLEARYAWARSYAAGKDVLEAACGAGVGLGCLAAVAKRVVGGDIDPSNCATARQTYTGRTGIEILAFDAENVPLPAASFDVVLLFEALYYLHSPETFVREARRLLRPGGVLLLSTVNCRWKGFNPSPFSRRYYDSAELAALLRQAGFEVRNYGGFPEVEGPLHTVTSLVRSAAVRLRLIPQTQKSKEWLKRIFYGKLQPIPRELRIAGSTPAELHPLEPPFEDETFRFLYCAATSPVAEA